MKKIVFLLLIALAVTSCSEKKKEEQKAPIRVETLVVSPGMTDNGQSYVGIVEEREATAVSFTSMGVLKRILVKEGQMVRRGQLLAEIDPSTSSNSVEMAHASVDQAKDMVKQAEATYNQAKDAYDRMKLLHDNGSLPEVKWIEAETRLAQATSALNTARSGVISATATEKIARKGLADTRLYAPVSGVIGNGGRRDGVAFTGCGEHPRHIDRESEGGSARIRDWQHQCQHVNHHQGGCHRAQLSGRQDREGCAG